jgi:hypothetical protein
VVTTGASAPRRSCVGPRVARPVATEYRNTYPQRCFVRCAVSCLPRANVGDDGDNCLIPERNDGWHAAEDLSFGIAYVDPTLEVLATQAAGGQFVWRSRGIYEA